MRFQDAAVDGRAVVYAAIQADPTVSAAASLLADTGHAERVLARAVMNGETTDASAWRTMFPTLFGPGVDERLRSRAEAVLAVSIDVAARGEQVRSQLRGAIVEAVTARLLGRRAETVRRERRILFDGRPAEIHPYDVTLEAPAAPEAYDCKWGARGINGDVIHQLEAARANAAAEGIRLVAALVVFDARRSSLVRLARQTAPHGRIALITIENLRSLARSAPAPATAAPR